MKLHTERSIDYQRFGKNLRKILKQRNLKQVDIACITGATRPNVSKWIHGVQFPCFGYLVKIAKYLDVSLDELTEGVVIDD